ncbi:hypothetical protein [Botrimarina hoheduenensis]|uniref:hypothetical protein n=1 Tax=Botrimarina hoheduenensis TaxID=2528000 RepID=UPI001E3F3040|nr:hypothetical protein [Botrimarina hoheduenensis]
MATLVSALVRSVGYLFLLARSLGKVCRVLGVQVLVIRPVMPIVAMTAWIVGRRRMVTTRRRARVGLVRATAE